MLKLLQTLAVISLLTVGCSRDPLSDVAARLSDPDITVRRAAARALMEQPIADERVIIALTKTTTDKDTEVRALSVRALGQLGPAAKPVMPNVKAALYDREKRVRFEAAMAVNRIDPNDMGNRAELTTAMQQGDGRALLAIGSMGPSAAWATPTLAGLLSHQSPQVRVLAAKTLGRIGPAAKEAKSALETARRDPNKGVQAAAKEALTKIDQATKSSITAK